MEYELYRDQDGDWRWRLWAGNNRIHKTLRVTPAMEAGVSSHVWSIGEIVDLLDAREVNKAA
jgi:hypothetical protein